MWNVTIICIISSWFPTPAWTRQLTRPVYAQPHQNHWKYHIAWAAILKKMKTEPLRASLTNQKVKQQKQNKEAQTNLIDVETRWCARISVPVEYIQLLSILFSVTYLITRRDLLVSTICLANKPFSVWNQHSKILFKYFLMGIQWKVMKSIAVVRTSSVRILLWNWTLNFYLPQARCLMDLNYSLKLEQ